MERWNLHTRVALTIIRYIGASTSKILLIARIKPPKNKKIISLPYSEETCSGESTCPKGKSFFHPVELPFKGVYVLGITVWIAIWWITEAIPIAAKSMSGKKLVAAIGIASVIHQIAIHTVIPKTYTPLKSYSMGQLLGLILGPLLFVLILSFFHPVELPFKGVYVIQKRLVQAKVHVLKAKV
jgi:di/tricarboxylate transporter